MKIGSAFREAYRRKIQNLVSNNGPVSTDDQNGYSKAVGGSFQAIGYLEKCLLKHLGLKSEHILVDVGCGSGRLTSQLEAHDIAGYLGTDISQELLNNCQRHLKGKTWSVAMVDGCTIPMQSASSNVVCMFSVITHLLHQESYLYFKEASRVLRPGGKLIVSFLEYRHPGLWPLFEASVKNVLDGGHLDTFVDREGLRLWAVHSGLSVVRFLDGETPHIPIERAIEFDNGVRASNYARLGPIGQSVAVFEKDGHK